MFRQVTTNTQVTTKLILQILVLIQFFNCTNNFDKKTITNSKTETIFNNQQNKLKNNKKYSKQNFFQLKKFIKTFKRPPFLITCVLFLCSTIYFSTISLHNNLELFDISSFNYYFKELKFPTTKIETTTNKLNYALVSSCVENGIFYNKPVIKASIENKLFYCKKYNIDCLIKREYNERGINNRWSKIAILKSNFETKENGKNKYDFLFWTDCDAAITNHNISLKTIYNSKSDIIASIDSFGLNLGVFFINNNNTTRLLLDKMYELRNVTSKKSSMQDQEALKIVNKTNPELLQNLEIIPKKRINAYPKYRGDHDWEKGDFIKHFVNCPYQEKLENCRKDYILSALCSEVITLGQQNQFNFCKKDIYGKNYNTNFTINNTKNLTDLFIKHLNYQPGSIILDFGSGYSIWSFIARSMGFKVFYFENDLDNLSLLEIAYLSNSFKDNFLLFNIINSIEKQISLSNKYYFKEFKNYSLYTLTEFFKTNFENKKIIINIEDNILNCTDLNAFKDLLVNNEIKYFQVSKKILENCPSMKLMLSNKFDKEKNNFLNYVIFKEKTNTLKLQAKNKLNERQIKRIFKVIKNYDNPNILIFGLDYNSQMWKDKTSGEVIFLEHDKNMYYKFLELYPSLETYNIQYNTNLKSFNYYLENHNYWDNLDLTEQLNEKILNISWHIILIIKPDAEKEPGKYMPLYTAKKLSSFGTTIFVKDCEQKIEKIYTALFFNNDNLVNIETKDKSKLCEFKIS